VHAFLLGLSLGFSAGVIPGPLLAVVVRATLEGGFGAGARVAVGPLITDLPIIGVAVVLAAALPATGLALLGLGGGAFLMWSGVRALREPAPAPVEAAAEPVTGSLRRGAIVNLLNPHPWVFWIAVGVPVLGDGGVADGIAFLVPFYIMLIGSKLVVAAVVGAGRARLLRGAGYRRALRVSGALLVLAGIALAIEGLGRLG
jgi:threonine/homoserine/homoserine lactone efflux protein